MKMTASTRLVNGVTIVDLSGRIVLGDGSAGPARSGSQAGKRRE